MMTLSFVILSSCNNETAIIGQPDQSKVILDENRHFLTIYTLFHNSGVKPTTPYYARFELKNDKLKEKLGSETIVFMQSNGEGPEALPVGKKSDFFVSETFEYEGTLNETDLVGAIEVVIYSEDDEEISSLVISHVEKE